MMRYHDIRIAYYRLQVEWCMELYCIPTWNEKTWNSQYPAPNELHVMCMSRLFSELTGSLNLCPSGYCWMPKRIPISHNIHYHKLSSADAAETVVTGSFICSTVPGLFRLRPVTLKPTARRPGTQTLSTCRCPEGLGHWQLSNSKFKHPMSKHSKQDKRRLKAATISRDHEGSKVRVEYTCHMGHNIVP